jgi:hypothetical protein
VPACIAGGGRGGSLGGTIRFRNGGGGGAAFKVAAVVVGALPVVAAGGGGSGALSREACGGGWRSACASLCSWPGGGCLPGGCPCFTDMWLHVPGSAGSGAL